MPGKTHCVGRSVVEQNAKCMVRLTIAGYYDIAIRANVKLESRIRYFDIQGESQYIR